MYTGLYLYTPLYYSGSTLLSSLLLRRVIMTLWGHYWTVVLTQTDLIGWVSFNVWIHCCIQVRMLMVLYNWVSGSKPSYSLFQLRRPREISRRNGMRNVWIFWYGLGKCVISLRNKYVCSCDCAAWERCSPFQASEKSALVWGRMEKRTYTR